MPGTRTVVQDLDLNRHGRRLTANAAGHDGHGAELAHGASGTQDDAAQERPLDVGQRHAAKHLPSVGAEKTGGLFLFTPRRFHHGNQLARDERKRHEDRRQHDAGYGEDDLDVVVEQPWSEPALPPEELNENQSGDDRRDGKGKIDQRREQALAAEIETGDRPRGANAKHSVCRHAQDRDDERQPDRRQRLRGLDRFDVGLRSVAKRLDEDEHERDDEK